MLLRSSESNPGWVSESGWALVGKRGLRKETISQQKNILYYMKKERENVMSDYEYSDDMNFSSCHGLYHVIEQGDTLYRLGKRYRVSVSDIMRANPYADVYNLQIGETLCIPAGNIMDLEVESTRKEHRFSENESVKEVLGKAGIPMSEFVQWLNQKN